MPFIADGRILVERAFKEHYTMPAFNVCSLEMARACVMAAELERAPIILQTYPGDLKQAPAPVMAAMVKALAEAASVPVMLHLDHGEGLEMVTWCLRAGYSSVMYDGAEHPLEENIRRTHMIAQIAHAASASLEAAGGSFGSDDEDAVVTDPDEAGRLKREGGADMIACSVGSRHGQESQLDLARLQAIAGVVRGPLVLHGGTGIPAEDVAEATELGVVKVNIGAGLVRALLSVWRSEAERAPSHYGVYEAAREALIEVARDKIRIMRAAGQA